MNGKIYLNNNQFFKRNYQEALEYITPKFLIEDDITTFGTEVNLVDQVINSHISIAGNLSSVLEIDPIPGTIFSSINTLEGIAPFFIKQNLLTEITSEQFNRSILKHVGRNISEFETSSAFSDYLTETLLPSIRLNNPTSYFNQGADVSASHFYLIENLSWLYFLNTSGTTYAPSAFVHDILISKSYTGRSISLADCLEGLSEHVWKNGLNQFIPESFLSSAGTFTSGTQQLDNLKTWVNIVYSPLYADRADFEVRDRFQTFIESQLTTENRISAGPFMKLLRALSMAIYDTNSDAEKLGALYDIEQCPDEYLPFLADLIGWKLFGTNPDRWRLQLTNAVEVYKRVGTKAGLQFALNSLFPKDQFNIEARITELWESYIPYLIYYSLATESRFFKDNTSWTQQIADSMNVVGYSTSSIDDNIRMAVDRIILETSLEFPESFNIPNKDNRFYYRGREYVVPPFEEYPYYVNVETNQDMIDFISDRLACFGVRKDFVLQVRSYLITNLIESDSEIRNSSWLFFTSDYCEPPNMDNLVLTLFENKFEYASLWNGKSSHFKLNFNSDEFDFALDDDLSVSSGRAIEKAAAVVHEFSPAHAIPLINLELSSADATDFLELNLPLITINPVDFSINTENITPSGLVINSYKRTSNPSGIPWTRDDVFSNVDPLLVNASLRGNIPRNTLRRRNLSKVLPKNLFYDRTGFNMPTNLNMQDQGTFPLGFIPSSLTYQDIPDYNNIPEVYSRCVTPDSNLEFYGYSASDAILCRGGPYGVSDISLTRGETPDIYILMHTLREKAKLYEASNVYTNSSLLDFEHYHVYQGYANALTNSGISFPNSVNDYYNFEFGIDLHTLYNIYTKNYFRHKIQEALHYQDGANIFAHVFGSILKNSSFNQLGQYSLALTTSSLSSTVSLPNGQGAFQGSYVASSIDSMYVDMPEIRASGAVYGVELVQTSGASLSNFIRVFKLPHSQKSRNSSSYMFDKTFLQLRSLTGFPRIRMDIKTYNTPTEITASAFNFLLPDCRYEFSLKALTSNSAGTYLGGGKVGIWIHTDSQNGKAWSYGPDGNWHYHDALLSRTDVINTYSHIFSFTQRNRLTESKESESLYKRLNCIEIVSGTQQSINPLLTFAEEDFEDLYVEFDTMNNDIVLPNEYATPFGNLHTKEQNYIVEIFQLPGNQNRDSFLLVDSVNLYNLTLKRLSEYLSSGTPISR